ncbi:hypothetical protein [Micromonospora sp. MW-13]|nr:hypothetical protein [Micromonospora sp. MW-13]
MLEDAGLLVREPDRLRSGRSSYRITEPLITLRSPSRLIPTTT